MSVLIKDTSASFSSNSSDFGLEGNVHPIEYIRKYSSGIILRILKGLKNKSLHV